MNNTNTRMHSLGFDDIDKNFYDENRIRINKDISRYQAEIRKESKLDYCYICKRPTTSFCNSHSVPRFCLKNISNDGIVFNANKLTDIPVIDEDSGVNSAGTFRIICRECDGKQFQEYENPENYNSSPNNKMLAQIAMKNYLQMISKRLYERALYEKMSRISPRRKNYSEQMIMVGELDICEYITGFERAKKAVSHNHDDWYYLCFYVKLDYTTPLAFQGCVTLICDFEENIINEIYNTDPEYHTKEIHIGVFPLHCSTAILMFIDSRDNRYRGFYKQLRKLTIQDQLSAINYIIFSNSENVFLSKNIDQAVLSHQKLIEICKQTNIVEATNPYSDFLETAKSSFSLKHRAEIPNLLSREYSLKIEE